MKRLERWGGGGDEAYLIMMARRLLQMHRILKPTGSLFLQCDDAMSHSLKLVLDSIFGKQNFRNEVIWERTRCPKKSRKLPRCHETIFYYNKGEKFTWNTPRHDFDINAQPPSNYTFDEEAERSYRLREVVATPSLGGKSPMYSYLGIGRKKPFTPKTRWLFTKKNLEEIDRRGDLVWNRRGVPYRKQYWDENKGKAISDMWYDLPSYEEIKREEDTGFNTQKPLALLERIISATTNDNDVVLDPFCGCATAMVAAERLDRQWIGIDCSDKAVELIRFRLQQEERLWRRVKNGQLLNIFHEPPTRSDRKNIIKNHDEHKRLLYGEQMGYCLGCGHHFPFHGLQMDHIKAQKRGGQDTDDNFQLLCQSCNAMKGTDHMEEFIAKRKNRGLPVHSRWL